MASSDSFAIVVSAPAIRQATFEQANLAERLANAKLTHELEVVSLARANEAMVKLNLGMRVFFHQGGAPSKWSRQFPRAGCLIAAGYYAEIHQLASGDPPPGIPLALWNTDMNATDPATLGYPIFHYATVWCILSDQTPGSDVTVSVKNLDGDVSDNLAYRIAANMDELDSDGDGLPDEWEKNGYDADGDGTVDIDLPSLGADPLRKDLFIECDWMNAAAPNNTIWAAIEDTFDNAPILNTDGSQGIAIHIDRGQAGAGGGGGTIIPYADRMRYDNSTPSPVHTYANFYTVKSNNFDNDRTNVYRYCVFAWDNGHWTGSSGQAEDIWANDFFVSLGSWGADGSRDEFQIGTFIHELGHTLNLRHGGFENANSKDNYNSIMQYGNNWIIWSGQNNKFSPSQFGGIDVDCDMLDVDAVYTYSQGMRVDLDESNLNENVGVCDIVARDWNGNGVMQPSVSVNLDDDTALTVISDYADWANIELDFRASNSNWGNN